MRGATPNRGRNFVSFLGAHRGKQREGVLK